MLQGAPAKCSPTCAEAASAPASFAPTPSAATPLCACACAAPAAAGRPSAPAPPSAGRGSAGCAWLLRSRQSFSTHVACSLHSAHTSTMHCSLRLHMSASMLMSALRARWTTFIIKQWLTQLSAAMCQPAN